MDKQPRKPLLQGFMRGNLCKNFLRNKNIFCKVFLQGFLRGNLCENFYAIRKYFARFCEDECKVYYIPVSSFASGTKYDIFIFLSMIFSYFYSYQLCSVCAVFKKIENNVSHMTFSYFYSSKRFVVFCVCCIEENC